MTRLKFDPVDLRLLAAFNSSVIIDDNNESAVITDCKVTIVRPSDDKLELTIEFAELDFPILLLRSKTLEELGVKDDDTRGS